MSNKNLLVAFFAGVLFAVGLAVAGMTRPGKVVGFLDVTGAWDPSLAFVMVGAIGVYAVGNRIVRRAPAPWLTPRWFVPTRTDLTPRLFAGAALFGAGWAIGGFCPGPAVVSLASMSRDALIFFPAMLTGMALFEGYEKYRARVTDHSPVGTAAP